VSWVEPMFLGTGPTLGYAFTTNDPDGISVTAFGYALITAYSDTIAPRDPNPVPAPATLRLAAGFARRCA
jgi:hypothetical protein